MAKKKTPAPKPPTHFEQVPVEVAVKVATATPPSSPKPPRRVKE